MRTLLIRVRRLCPLLFVAAAVLSPVRSDAQNSVTWTTNYYTVTGATLPEIQRSLRQNRPWKESKRFDGWTSWRIEWRSSVTQGADDQWRVSRFTTRTVIVTTLPRWAAPADAPESTRRIWARYLAALEQHEAGHARIAVDAAAAKQRRVHGLGLEADASVLRQRISELSRQTLAEYQKREEEYDRRTHHGALQGAVLSPGR